MNVKNNKRGQETQQKIEDAFVTLLQEKSLREVEVSEICELAQINRSTFSAHYDSVSALANAFCEKTEEIVLAQPHTADDYTWLFACIKNHRQRFSAYFKLGIREVRADYKTLFLRSAIHGVAKLWFENGCVETVDKMGKLLMREISR